MEWVSFLSFKESFDLLQRGNDNYWRLATYIFRMYALQR